MIEKEFKRSVKYLAIDRLNFSAYSDVYAKLLLQTGSEVDVVAKLLCKAINTVSTAENIMQYQTEICSKFPDFENVTVTCWDIVLKPWNGWTLSSPEWWKVYNGVKHSRNKVETYGTETKENYKFANQKNLLNALAGLYQMEQYLYTLIEHAPEEETPLPGSRLYRLKDHGWENKRFAHDSIFYINENEGTLHQLYAAPPYSDI